jgi:hypothetical protein
MQLRDDRPLVTMGVGATRLGVPISIDNVLRHTSQCVRCA